MKLATYGLTLLAVTSTVILASAQEALKAPDAAKTPVLAPGARLVQEDPDGFTVRIRIPEPAFAFQDLPDGRRYQVVTVPGFIPGSDAPAGYPDMPQQGHPFGIPEGASARLAGVRILASSTVQGETPLPVPRRRYVPGSPLPEEQTTYTPDAEAYRSGTLFPGEVAALGPVMGWRHQRVQSLIVNPVRVSPSTGRYEVVRELEVIVRFETERTRPAARREPVTQDAPGWDETMDRTLLNAASARAQRTRPVPAVLPQVTAAGETNLRIRIGGTGLCRVPYADLEAQGWPAGVPVGEVRVEERGYDGAKADPFLVSNLPRGVEDTNQNGTFDPGDFLVFYGLNYADRFPSASISDSRFSYFHTYWVHDGSGGLDFPVMDGYPAGTGYTAVASYPRVHREEKSLVYTNSPKDSGASIFPIYDTFYWLDDRAVNTDLPFAITNLDPAGTFRLRARWQGNSSEFLTRVHYLSLDLNGKTVLDDTTTVERFPFLYDSGPLLIGDYLREGADTLTVRGHSENPVLKYSGAYFDWFEISYDRLLQAVDDRLAFTSGARTGPLEFTVTGFSSPDVLVLDVTDPTAPFALTPQVTSAGGTYTLRLRVTVAGGTRRYVAAVRSSATGLPPSPHALPPDLTDGLIAPGLPRDLLVDGAGSDYILITHPEFEDAWAPLVAHREAVGHRVFLCNVFEIYDQFAGGDKTPWAIQRFLTQAYRTWDPSPSFLLLGGDASEDYRTDNPLANPDYVPTMMHFGNVPGVVGLELCGTDSWYAAFLREGDPSTDVLPEMNVARIPVGSVGETQAVVQKILDYEAGYDAPEPADPWRKRGLFVADDQYSSNILGTGGYCWQSGEASFRATTLAVCDSLELRARLTDFECRTFFMADHLDTVAALGRVPGDPRNCPDPLTTYNYVRSKVTPGFRDLLSQGYLIWEFTGHANATLITHEGLYANNPRFTSQQDVERTLNFGKPFLFMGYACHLFEFESYTEKVNGESIGEYLLLAPNRGAIAVFASTGYEWLHTNPVAQVRTTRPLFWDLAKDPATGRPRRLFGESITRGMAQLILEQPTRQDYVGMIRTYQPFGDPALRVDIRSSRLVVTVNGEDWSPGTPLTAASFGDSVSVQAVISDDVDVSTITVKDGDQELPPNRVTVIPPGAGDQGVQTYTVAFATTLHLGDYDLTIEARDWAGRVTRFAMPVRMGVEFLADGVLIDPNAAENPVDPAATLGIRIHSPVGLTEAGFEVFLDDDPVAFSSAQTGSPADWELTLTPGLFAGDHDVRLRISDPLGGAAEWSAEFQVGSGPLVMAKEVYFYPNPVETAGGSLIYTLNRNPQKMEAHVSIYTVSGRRVLDTLIPARAGTNRWDWDLRDGRGDFVANGIYMLVMRLRGLDDTEIITDGRKRDGKEPFEVLRIAVTR